MFFVCFLNSLINDANNLVRKLININYYNFLCQFVAMFFLQNITITVLIILLLLCVIFVFPLGLLVTETVKGGHGIFNV